MDVNTGKQPEPAGPVHTGRVAAGAIIMTMGLVMLFDRSELLGDNLWHAFPGFVLIALGLVSLANTNYDCKGRRQSPLNGVWLIFIGSWLTMNFLHLFGFNWINSWPLVIVAGGTMIVLKEVFPGLREERGKGRD
jgi:LiaF transmembrane domain